MPKNHEDQRVRDLLHPSTLGQPPSGRLPLQGRLGQPLAAAILMLLTLLPTGCGKEGGTEGQPVAASAIKIGAISPFTGDGARYGTAARTGIDLAVEEINEAGGINGRTLTVRYEDDKGNQTDAVSALNKLVTVDRVPAVLGPFYSGNVLACAPVANRTKTVILTGSATSDNIREAGEYIFRVCPSNDEQARTIAQFARADLRLDTAFIIYRNVDYGVTLRDAFEGAFKSLGGTIVGSEAIVPDSSDARVQLAKVKSVNPDMIFAAVHYTEGGAILKQAKELAIQAIVVGTDGGHDPQIIQIAGEAAEGSYWVTIGWGADANPAVTRFQQAYRERYGSDPGVYSGLYYDATHVIAKALAGAESLEGSDIQRALLRTTFDGVTGRTAFDENGDVSKPYTIYRIVGGTFQVVR